MSLQQITKYLTKRHWLRNDAIFTYLYHFKEIVCPKIFMLSSFTHFIQNLFLLSADFLCWIVCYLIYWHHTYFVYRGRTRSVALFKKDNNTSILTQSSLLLFHPAHLFLYTAFSLWLQEGNLEETYNSFQLVTFSQLETALLMHMSVCACCIIIRGMTFNACAWFGFLYFLCGYAIACWSVLFSLGFQTPFQIN